MKLSRFNIWVKNYPSGEDYLLFNARTQALIRINQAFKNELEAFVSGNTAVDCAQVRQNLIALKNNGIIVENEQEEQAKLDDFFRQLKYETCGLSFEATILTTYSCNFKCVYCFEESVKENVFLDQKTSSLIVNWLINKAKHCSAVRFYGCSILQGFAATRRPTIRRNYPTPVYSRRLRRLSPGDWRASRPQLPPLDAGK